MRMTAKLFGVLCAASLVFCAACDGIGNKAEDNDKKDDTVVTVSYDVGTIVEFNGKDYLVTKNSEATDVARAMVNTDRGQYYLNENASAYRDTLLASYGVTNYVELFDIAEDKSTNSSNQAVLYDTFMILCGGEGLYKIRQRWISKDLFPDQDAEAQNKSFEAKENNVLREQYEPNLFIISNTMFETDVAKRFQDEYAFDYDDTMRIDFSNSAMANYILKRTGYVSINSTTKSTYAIRDKKQKNALLYELENYNVSRFFEFGVYPNSYQLTTQGDGKIDGSTSSALYQCVFKIASVEYNPSLDKVRIEGDITIGSKEEITEDVEAGFENRFARVSSEKTVVGTFTVPKTITFSAPFKDSSAVLNKYAKVTFIPEVKNGGVIYVPKPDSTYSYDFIAQFVKDYQTVFGKDTSSLQPDVELQPDSDIGSDMTTPRFTFSGDSLRIELEEMKHNFVLSEESAASGGKAGKLVDENSRAEAIITFPAGSYSGYAVIRAPDSSRDAFNVKFGDTYVRVYADDPPPAGYARTSRTPINLSCDKEVTVRMTILKDNPNRPDKPGETGMFIDYVEFTKTGSQAGQGGSETPEPGAGKADWTGFTMVDSADELDFKIGTYEMKCADFEEYQGKTKFDTMIYDVEISADTVVLREKSRIRVYGNQEDYDIKKASIKDIDGYSWEDSTRTIIRTYSDVSNESMSLSEFKEEFFSFSEDVVEDNYSRILTDKKLGRKNGVIQASCTETICETEVERTEKYYYIITLTPQK
ncbi:MAG: hypothetical protein K2N31_05820 [Treponemataceae bacterium]|nr:hypothetical protein [Treponemataceae bacterium]